MRLAVFTSNQPRHIALLDALTEAGHDVVAVIEPKTWLLPESGVMREYWTRVRWAESDIFHTSPFVRVPALVLRPGELSAAPMLPGAQRYVVFSSSYITGQLAETLVERGAINLHAGIAPKYRGSAPNMWAQYDGNPHLIGAQVQRLSTGLDAGDILAEVRPPAPVTGDYFTRSMLAVKLGIEAMVRLLATPEPWTPVRANDPAMALRYSRHTDFTEAVAAKILGTA